MKPTSLKRNSFYENLYQLDRILRGDATRPEHLKKAEIEIPIVGISLTIICLAIVYGFCMGVFALVRGFENSAYASALMQTSASMCKVPLLFMLTLLVTFPSLYVFNALAGSKLKMVPVLKLLIASLSVNIAVLASMGPILAFFSLSTPNYQFIVLLNVIVFAVAGILGLVFLIQTLGRLTDQASEKTKLNLGSAATVVPLPTDVHRTPESLPKPPVSKHPTSTYHHTRTGPLDLPANMVLGSSVWRVFYCWLAVFCLVGCQMGWVLRPFIGSPDLPFEWFRSRHSNFFEAVFNLIF